jgi:hypothetical protein
MQEILTHPLSAFLIGLGVGVVLAFATWVSGALHHRKLKQEIQNLQRHLHTQMTITTRGQEELQKELQSLRQQNENLRVTVANLQQKPGRAEIRTLHLYDRAIALMHQRAPGFAPAWEGVLREAEEEIKGAESGLGKLLKKVFRPSLLGDSPIATKPVAEAPGEDEKGSDS